MRWPREVEQEGVVDALHLPYMASPTPWQQLAPSGCGVAHAPSCFSGRTARTLPSSLRAHTQPIEGPPTIMGLTMNISLADWGYTAAATGFMYMWGYRYSECRGGRALRAVPRKGRAADRLQTSSASPPSHTRWL